MTRKTVRQMWAAIAEGKPELLDDLDMQRAPRRRPVQHEANMQAKLVVQLRKHLPPGSIVFAVPNQASGGARHGYSAARKGQLAGVPDLFCVVNGQFYGIECKSDKGRLSAAQIDMHERFEAQGVPCCVVRSVAEAIDFLEKQGVCFRA